MFFEYRISAPRADFYNITPQARKGNSTALLKASAIGSSATVIVNGGKPMLGTWQERKFFVKVLE